MLDFTADYNAPSIHVTKSRVWALWQFYPFLTLHRIVAENIATALPYPKTAKTVAQFLTQQEYKRLIRHFINRADAPMGLRNLGTIAQFLGVQNLSQLEMHLFMTVHVLLKLKELRDRI